MYLADSFIPNSGKGIFIAKTIEPLDKDNNYIFYVLEVSPTISIDLTAIKTWGLNNYAFTSNYGHAMVVLGSSTMYNHDEKLNNIEFFWTENSIEDPDVSCNPASIVMDDYSRCNRWDYVLTKPVVKGTELFLNYGGMKWFEDTGIEYNAPENSFLEEITVDGTIQKVAVNHNIHSLEYLQKYGVCMSHLFVSPSQLHQAGNGLYSKIKFKKGELLIISPVLLLPKYEVILASRNDSVLLNYVIAQEGDVAIFAFGLPVMANHQSNALTNVYLQWYNTSSAILNSYHPQDFIKDKSTSLYLGLYASRDIEANDELFMDYGVDWEKQWNAHILRVSNHQENDPPRKGFRFPLYPPSDLIPTSWKDIACIGIICDNE